MSPTPSKSTTSIDQRKLTAVDVIGMFRALDLPVTDDAQQIEAKGNELRPLYLRRKGSPDPQQRSEADFWFKNLTRLQRDRLALFDLVRAQFTQLADAALEAALSSGTKELTPKLYAQLERLALEQCQCDPSLARQFVEGYLQENTLEIGKVFVRPGHVERFTAAGEPGRIVLNWSLPTGNWDEVEIVRQVELPLSGKQKAATGETIYRGRDACSFVDSGVAPGNWYRYTLSPIFHEVKGAEIIARAPCLGEARNVQALWTDGKVRLTWELPGEDVSVVIFRRSGGPPAIRRGPHGLEPADGATERVYPRARVSLEDRQVSEGIIYYYRIIADFGQGIFTAGEDVQVQVPKAPPAVAAVTATYVPSARGDEVVMEWQPAQTDVQVEYVVVRRTGSAPPGGVKDGEVVATIREARYLDQQVIAGYRYTYAVFTRAGETYSRMGTTAPPVDILAEVAALRAEAGDGIVELHWHTPANISRVIVCRHTSPPRDHTDGRPVGLTGADHAKDEGLDNGQCYHYLVICAYRPTGGAEVFSPGVRIAAMPYRLPEPITDFQVQAQGLEVRCTWSPPACGQVVVLRSARPPGLLAGQRLTVDELDRLGERIATANDRAQDVHPDVSRPYYSAFTVAGMQAVAGGSGCGVVCPDVTDLRLSATKDGIILRWTWSPGCTAVRVARRLDTWPAEPDDPQATWVPFTRAQYMAAGEKFVDTIQQSRGLFHYIVYAQATGAPGLFFALGVGPGCRAAIQWEPPMILRYRLSSPEKGDPHQGAAVRLGWSIERPFPNFAGLALVAREAEPPSTPDDGIELFRWTPQEEQMEGAHEAWVSLGPIQQRRWARFFCKAFVADSAQRHATLMIHPNTCVPISDQGEVHGVKLGTAEHKNRFGVPRTVICPHCFEEFPIERMLFDSFAGGERLATRYTWLDRWLRRPPQPPTNKQGQRLARKLCPNSTLEHLHVLPFTAGTRASLVIGVIGAKFSGKSHYIAALVERLAGQVAADLQADLLPVTDETYARYQREFYDPLFGKGLELPVTIGAPPPLIYDLSLDGRLWGEQRNRGVTLALYDTAGENFDDPNTVRQMVRYLRVASGIIFLIDPLQSPVVREALPTSIPLPNVDLMAEPYIVISRVLTELENGRILTRAGPLLTPVAVVLTKCDVLRDAGLIEANRLWSSDKRHIGYFDRAAHDDMSGMMAEYMLHWSQKAYNTVSTRFARYAFFGISSTGCASDKVTRRYKYISPWRVEDPLLWLLAELGVIPARSGETEGAPPCR